MDPAEGTREDYLIEALRRLDDQARRAEQDGSWVAAVRATSAALRVRAELDKLRAAREAGQRQPADQAGGLEGEARRLRIAATEAGSFGAAARLLLVERELADEADTARTEEEADRLAALREEEIERELEELRARRTGRKGRGEDEGR